MAGGLLGQYASQPSTFPGMSLRPTGLDFSAFGGQNSMMLQMLLQPIISQMMGSAGLIPGQFQPTQNLHDFQHERQWGTQLQAAMTTAAAADRESYMRTARGIAVATGTPFRGAQFRAAQRMSGDVAALAPFIAQFAPELLDQATGPMGSAVVASRFVHMGGRYTIDPVTQQLGLSGESSGAISAAIRNRAATGDMHGIASGRAGMMYDELVRRGFVGQGVDRATRDTMQSVLPAVFGASASETNSAIRGINADKAADKIKEYSGAVAAMRNIFGDAGHPNAPMAELINALQALTQGGMTSMSPAKLEASVRQLHNLARASGKGIDGMVQLMSMVSGMTDNLGLDRQFATNITSQSLAYGAAFKAGAGGPSAWGKSDPETIMALDARRRAQGAKSPISRTFNAILRMADEGLIDPKSELGKIAEDLRLGKKVDLKSPMAYRDLANAAGIDNSTWNAIMTQEQTNAQYGVKYETEKLAVRYQKDTDIGRIGEDRTIFSLRAAGLGLNNAELGKTGEAAMKAIWSLSDEQLAKGDKRNAAIVDKMWESLSPEAKARIGDKSKLLGTASAIWGEFEKVSKPHYQSGHNAVTMNREETFKKAAAIELQAKIRGEFQKATDAVSWHGPLRRAIGMVQDMKPGEEASLIKNLGEIFGGIPKEEIEARILPMLQKYAKTEKSFDTASGTLGQQIAAQNEANSQLRVLLGGNPKAADELEKKGLLKWWKDKNKESGYAMGSFTDMIDAALEPIFGNKDETGAKGAENRVEVILNGADLRVNIDREGKGNVALKGKGTVTARGSAKGRGY